MNITRQRAHQLVHNARARYQQYIELLERREQSRRDQVIRAERHKRIREHLQLIPPAGHQWHTSDRAEWIARLSLLIDEAFE